MIEEITEAELMGRINTDGIVLVEIYKQGSKVCEQVHEILRELQNTCLIYCLNIEKALTITSEYGIKTVPTILLLENGREQQRFEGKCTIEMLLMAMELFRK